MLRLYVLCLCVWGVFGYFTLPGKCPENVQVQENFNIVDFYGKWYQAYYYSSDGLRRNNCSTIQMGTRAGSPNNLDPVIYFNQSRIDRGLFHRYSEAKLKKRQVLNANIKLRFDYKDAPRRLKSRSYKFHILATNYNYYATAYTCQYSPLINKHFIYVWILSRNPILNDVSKELALRPLQRIGVVPEKLIKDDQSKCNPKYYDDAPYEPTTFNYPVPI